MQHSSRPIPASRFADRFSLHEANIANSKAFIEGIRKFSYRELFRDIRCLAAYFHESELPSGTRILIASDDDIVVSTLFIAALRCGLTAVVLDPDAAPLELKGLISYSDARLHFMDSRIIEKLAPAGHEPHNTSIIPISQRSRRSGIRNLFSGSAPPASTGRDYQSLLKTYKPVHDLPEPVDPEQTAYILYTSGTTSTPKGVEISHRSLDAQLSTFLQHYQLNDSVRLLNQLPLYHADGLTQGPVLAFSAGATTVRPFRFSVPKIPELLDTVYQYRVTHFVTVPSVLAMLHEFGRDRSDAFRTEDFQFIVSTAAPLDEKVWRSFEDVFGAMIVNVYGLTETVNEAMYCGPDSTSRKIGTIGKPIGCEAKIVDSEDRQVADGESGELVIRGDIVMQGYFRRPDETAKVLRDGWFYTGDIASIDDQGFYSIIGRKKNVVIVGGINVYPEDIVRVLSGMPGIRDAVAFGEVDSMWGEIPVACVVRASDSTISAGDVQEYFLAHASRSQLPRRIYFLDELPRGPAGKVLLQRVRDIVDQQTQQSSQSGDVREQVIQIAARILKMDPDDLSENSDSASIARWDSLTHVEFLFSIEKQLGIRFEPHEIFNVRGIGDAIRVVSKKAGRHSDR